MPQPGMRRNVKHAVVRGAASLHVPPIHLTWGTRETCVGTSPHTMTPDLTLTCWSSAGIYAALECSLRARSLQTVTASAALFHLSDKSPAPAASTDLR